MDEHNPFGLAAQCRACPWRKHAEPLGGSAATVEPFTSPDVGDGLRLMACLETKPPTQQACVGWLGHELGRGNNHWLRLAMIGRRRGMLGLWGAQHESVEDMCAAAERARKAAGHE